MIIFDTSYMVVLLHPNPPPAKDRNDKPVTYFRERVQNLIRTMDISASVIGVPTPVVTEMLVKIVPKYRDEYIKTLSDRYRFEIKPFGIKAAIEAAELISQLKAEHKSQPIENWSKVKFDIQIVSIAKAENATVIYADDKDIENYAKRLRITVVRICDLPVPLPVEPTEALSTASGQNLLFESRRITTPAQEDAHAKEAGPAAPHPPEVRGSGGRVPEGQAAEKGEVQAEKKAAEADAKTETEPVTAQEPKPCECGCGEYPKTPGARFLPGHDLRKAYRDSKGDGPVRGT